MSNISLSPAQWQGVQSSLRDAHSPLHHQAEDRRQLQQDMATHNQALETALGQGTAKENVLDSQSHNRQASGGDEELNKQLSAGHALPSSSFARIRAHWHRICM